VTAVGVGTVAIKDGDTVEVDGTNGKVTILKRAAELAEAPTGDTAEVAG
jgi:pyruvate,water dikinase